ncbi:response regulator transcription factor [Dehalococcoidia bacterium]|nr:response regulator transcription factor [Dehalococcoidia bacterium]MCL0082715.1 response regulator transcription factor [Dehalococcoidia bacterium]
MDKIKVMIIDEQALFRAGVRQVLSQQSDLEILDCDPNQNLPALIEANLPDVALLGSDLADLSGLQLGRKIALHFPNTKVIVLSPNPNDEELFEVIKTAAVACLSKNSTAEELASTIRRACNGEYPINESLITRPTVARHVLNQFQHMRRTMEAVVAPLTYRETQILDCIADGNTNKEIARILGISQQTIKNHVSAILRKLNANDRAHAVVLAIRHGWISAEEKL